MGEMEALEERLKEYPELCRRRDELLFLLDEARRESSCGGLRMDYGSPRRQGVASPVEAHVWRIMRLEGELRAVERRIAPIARLAAMLERAGPGTRKRDLCDILHGHYFRRERWGDLAGTMAAARATVWRRKRELLALAAEVIGPEDTAAWDAGRYSRGGS